MSKHKHYIIPIFVPHIGCPHDCIFCNQKKITGSNEIIDYNFVLKRADEYLKTIKRENSVVELSFYGGSFTGIPFDYQRELLEAANKLYFEGKIDSIRLSTRPDYINEFILDNLKKYNVNTIELGVQSLDDEVLKVSERGHDSQDVFKAVEIIKKYGFNLGLQMMIGLPMDTEEKDIETAKKIVELKPDFVRIYPALVIKDTNLEYMYTQGIYKPLTLEEAVNICKKLYLIFVKNEILIIRVGLQASEGIALGKDVIAGPFHPSFRELVESLILNKMVECIIENEFKNSISLTIKVSRSTLSKLYSNAKFYYKKLIEKYSDKNISTLVSNQLQDFEVVIESDIFSRKMSIKDYAKIAI